MKFVAWMIAWLACLALWVMPVGASITPEYLLPITSIAAGEQFARIPDWSQISLRSLPPIQAAGEFTASLPRLIRRRGTISPVSGKRDKPQTNI